MVSFTVLHPFINIEKHTELVICAKQITSWCLNKKNDASNGSIHKCYASYSIHTCIHLNMSYCLIDLLTYLVS